MNSGKWPKARPEVTAKQERIIQEHGAEWDTSSSGNFKWIEEFNQTYPANNCRPGGVTLEIGCGSGDQITYETYSEYHALDIQPRNIEALLHKYGDEYVKAIVADCEKQLPYPDGKFDKVLAIHVLEHLYNLPACLREVRRVLKPGGEFGVVIPCEGGFVRRVACLFDVKRGEKGVDYDWFLSIEHCNNVWEVLEELDRLFMVEKRCYFPFRIPVAGLNLKLGLVMKPKKDKQ